MRRNQEREVSDPVRWGVLGVAGIATHKAIPGMQASPELSVEAIASRSPEKAETAAKALGIPKAHPSYESLLADPDIEAVYIPLPNHLHREWTVAAAEAGKHVLCEKPLAMTSADAVEMAQAARRARVELMEAFMYRLHPLWRSIVELIDGGAIGEVHAVQSFFSYFNVDPDNIRNRHDYGGGALFDIGCYSVNVARMLFRSEPEWVEATIVRDPVFGTDVLTSALLDFDGRHATFTCSTQLEPEQRVHIHGTAGRVLVEIPFNIPPDRATRFLVYAGGDPPVAPGVEIHEVASADQYRIQAEEFSRAIRTGTAVPIPIEDAIANLRVLERVLAAAEGGE
jgi:predicted dehydrogenase